MKRGEVIEMASARLRSQVSREDFLVASERIQREFLEKREEFFKRLIYKDGDGA